MLFIQIVVLQQRRGKEKKNINLKRKKKRHPAHKRLARCEIIQAHDTSAKKTGFDKKPLPSCRKKFFGRIFGLLLRTILQNMKMEYQPNENTESNEQAEPLVKVETENPETIAETDDKPAEEQPTTQQDIEEELEKLRQQIEEWKDKYIRLYADFDNAKKRHAREQLELIQTAGKNIIQDLLPVLDDFERALKTLETATDVSAVKEGILLIYQKLFNTLTAKGLKAMEVLNKEFNVEEHEALTEIPAPSADLAGKILDEVQKGYLLNGKIIRFAKVVVGK
jgi:molecular chaperone GrpE